MEKSEKIRIINCDDVHLSTILKNLTIGQSVAIKYEKWNRGYLAAVAAHYNSLDVGCFTISNAPGETEYQVVLTKTGNK